MHLFSSQNCKELLRVYLHRSKSLSRDLVIVPNNEVKNWLEFQLMQEWGCSFGVEILTLPSALGYFFQFQEVWKGRENQITCMSHPKTLFWKLLQCYKESSNCSEVLSSLLEHISSEEGKIAELFSLSRILYEVSESGAYEVLLCSESKKNSRKNAAIASLYRELVVDCCFSDLPKFHLAASLGGIGAEKVLSHRVQWHQLKKNWQSRAFPFERTTFFAPNHFSLPLLEFLEQIHKEPSGIEIDIYQVSPSAYPWYDSNHLGSYQGEEFTNRLLDRLTLFARDGVRKVCDLSQHSEDFYFLDVDTGALYSRAPAKAPYIAPFCRPGGEDGSFSLLKQLQADLLCAVPFACNKEESEEKLVGTDQKEDLGDGTLQFYMLSSKIEEVEKAVSIFATSEGHATIFAPCIGDFREEIRYVCQRAGVAYFICDREADEGILALKALSNWVYFAQNGATTKDFFAAFQAPLGRECFGFEEQDFLLFEFMHSLGLEGGLEAQQKGSWYWAVQLIQEYALGFHGKSLEAFVSLKGMSTKELLEAGLRFQRLLLWSLGLAKKRSFSQWMLWLSEQLVHSDVLTQIHLQLQLNKEIEEYTSDSDSFELSSAEFWSIWLQYGSDAASSIESASHKSSSGFFEVLSGKALCFASLSDFTSIGSAATVVMGMSEEGFEKGVKEKRSFLNQLTSELDQVKGGSRGSCQNYYLLLAIMASKKQCILTCSPGETLSLPCQTMMDLHRYKLNRLVDPHKKPKQTERACFEKVLVDKDQSCHQQSVPISPDSVYHLSDLERVASSPIRACREKRAGASARSLYYQEFGPQERPPFLSRNKETRIEQHILAERKFETPEVLQNKDDDLYMPASDQGLYTQIASKGMQMHCKWRKLPVQYKSLSRAVNLLYTGDSPRKDLLPAIEVQTQSFSSPYYQQNKQLFPSVISIEALIATRVFDYRRSVSVYNVADLFRLWPSILIYAMQTSSNKPIRVEFTSSSLKGREMDLSPIALEPAFTEWIEWAVCAQCEISPLQPLWLESYLKEDFQSILDEIEKALKSQKSLVQEDPFLLEWVWLNKKRDFEAWLKSPQLRLVEFSKLLVG